MSTNPWSTDRSFVEHLRAAAAVMHDAGISVYLAEYMDGTRYSDNVIEGDSATRYANIPAWTMRANPDGTFTMAVCVRGGPQGLYEREAEKRGHLALRTADAESFGRHSLADALRHAGMAVTNVGIGAYDIGFGTRDIDYLATYTPSRP